MRYRSCNQKKLTARQERIYMLLPPTQQPPNEFAEYSLPRLILFVFVAFSDRTGPRQNYINPKLTICPYHFCQASGSDSVGI